MHPCQARLHPLDYAYRRPRMQMAWRRCGRPTSTKVRGHYMCTVCYGRDWYIVTNGSEEVIRYMFTFGTLWKDTQREVVPGKPHYVMELSYYGYQG